MAAEKLGHDARPYTFDGFVLKYGDVGPLLWSLAPPAFAGASPTGYGATNWCRAPDGQPYPWAERRFAHDGKPYTHAQFCQHFGPTAGSEHWQFAPVSFAGAPQPSILTELRGGIDGFLYTWSDFVDHYGPSQGAFMWWASAPTLLDGTATACLLEPQQVSLNLAQASDVPSAVALPKLANLPPGLCGREESQVSPIATQLRESQDVRSVAAATPLPDDHDVHPPADVLADGESELGRRFRRVWSGSYFCEQLLPPAML